MDTEQPPDHTVLRVPTELATALVAAQKATDSLRRDGKGNNGAYTTSDAIAAAASKALNDHGAAFVRVSLELAPGALAESDIGKNNYVGDLIEGWIIVHESGAAIRGSSTMPVVTSRGRPHDKAVAASLTFDTGGVLRGALCMDRESKDGIDKREDADDGSEYRRSAQGPQRQRQQQPARQPQQQRPPLCSGKGQPIADAIRQRRINIAALAHDAEVPDVTAEGIYRRALVELRLIGPDQDAPEPERLVIDDGRRVADYMKRWESPEAMENLR